MDFPGYGFSDKPLGWGYSLVRDAEVLEHFVGEVLGLESMTMLAHDRGSSVAMIHATGGGSRVSLTPGVIADRLGSPLLVDRSRSELPRAADLLQTPA